MLDKLSASALAHRLYKFLSFHILAHKMRLCPFIFYVNIQCLGHAFCVIVIDNADDYQLKMVSWVVDFRAMFYINIMFEINTLMPTCVLRCSWARWCQVGQSVTRGRWSTALTSMGSLYTPCIGTWRASIAPYLLWSATPMIMWVRCIVLKKPRSWGMLTQKSNYCFKIFITV